MIEIPPETLAIAATVTGHTVGCMCQRCDDARTGSHRCGCRSYDPVHNVHTEAGHTDCGGLSWGTPCGGCDTCISAQVWYWERRRAESGQDAFGCCARPPTDTRRD